MYEIKTANKQMRIELKDVLMESFKMNPDAIMDAFFRERVEYENCLIAVCDGKIISALYLFYSEICFKKRKIPAYYIYSAGTLPKYRSNGVMTELLMYAREIAKRKKCKYLFLLPQTKDLYKFYGNRGFCKFFKKRECLILRSDLERYAKGGQINTSVVLNIDEAHEIREKSFNFDGNVSWNKNHFEYSILLNNLRQGFMIYSERGYAMCSKLENNCLVVKELAVLESDFSNLMANIIARANCEMYLFRTSAMHSYFGKTGVVSDYGMLLPVDELDQVPEMEDPYIGLTME